MCKAVTSQDPFTFGLTAGTDAGLIAQAGVATLVFGPGITALAHTDKEHIDIEQIFAAARIYARALIEMVGLYGIETGRATE